MNSLLKKNQKQLKLYKKRIMQLKAKMIYRQLEFERNRANSDLNNPNIYFLLSQLWDIAGEYEKLKD